MVDPKDRNPAETVSFNIINVGDQNHESGVQRSPNSMSSKRNLRLGTAYPEVIDPEKDILLPQKVKRRDPTSSYGTIAEMEPIAETEHPGPFSATLQLVPVAFILGLALGIYDPIIVELLKSRVCEYSFNFTRNICLDLDSLDAVNLSDSSVNSSDVAATTTEITARLSLLSGLLSSLPCIVISLFMVFQVNKIAVTVKAIRIGKRRWSNLLSCACLFRGTGTVQSALKREGRDFLGKNCRPVPPGSWSDNFGRKLPMTLPFLGFILSALIAFLASYYPLHPYIILASPFCLSLFGGWVVLQMAIFSYLAENTPSETRSIAVAFTDGTLLIGRTAGTLLSGQLLERLGFAIPLFIYGALPVLAVLYVQATFKERGMLNTKRPSSCAVFTTRNLTDNVKLLTRHRPSNARQKILLLLLCASLGLVFLGDQTVLQLITEKAPLLWDFTTYTQFISLQGLAVGAALTLITPVFKFLSIPDTLIAVISCISAILCAYGFAFSTTTTAMITAAGAGILRNFHVVLTRSMLVPLVEKDELGKLMSAYAALQALSPLLQALFFGSMFALTVTWWPGFGFVVGSFAFVLSLAIFCYIDLD